jgi:hypothetical protein
VRASTKHPLRFFIYQGHEGHEEIQKPHSFFQITAKRARAHVTGDYAERINKERGNQDQACGQKETLSTT